MGATAASGDLEGGALSPAGSRTRRESLSRWIARTTGHHLDARSDKGFCEGLWDGVVLCRVLETLAPGVVPNALRADDPRLRRHDSPDKFLHRHNYEQFVAGAARVGVKDGDLFALQDLGGVTGSPGDVLRCLEAVRECVGVAEETETEETNGSNGDEKTCATPTNETFAFISTPPPTVYVPSVDFARLSLASGVRSEDSETKDAVPSPETRKEHPAIPGNQESFPGFVPSESPEVLAETSSSFAEISSSPTEVSSRRLPTTPPDTAGSAGSFFASPSRSSSCSTVRRRKSVSFGNPSESLSAGGSTGGSSDRAARATKKKSRARHNSSMEALSAELESAESAARAEFERRLDDAERELINARQRLNESFRREARATANAEDAERRAEEARAEAERLRRDNEALSRKVNETSVTSVAIDGVNETTDVTNESLLERVSLERVEAFRELETTRETLNSAMRAAKKNDAEFTRVSKRLVVTENRLRDVLDTTVPSLRATLETLRREADVVNENFAKKMSHDLSIATSRLVAKALLYERAAAENKKLHFQIQELKGSVRVFCRVRPFVAGMDDNHTNDETETPAVVATKDAEGSMTKLVVTRRERRGDELGKLTRRSFSFDKTFGPDASQAEVYQECGSLIRCVADGYNVCLLAYGQTGSGKTHTMSGPTNGFSDEDALGVNYRALDDVFRVVRQRDAVATHVVTVSVLEIYNEECRDLLAKRGTSNKIDVSGVSNAESGSVGSNGVRTNKSKNNGAGADNVPDAVARVVENADDVYAAMREGELNRSTGATAMNVRSSRSHSVVIVRVEATSFETLVKTKGALFLVDLAGSERVNRSEASGDRLVEARHINKSLSSLGDVVSALQQRQNHVPYRNSKLTTLLRGALGPNGKALLFVHVSPCAASADESVSTLVFAERAAAVELGKARRFSERLESTKETKTNAEDREKIRMREVAEMRARVEAWEKRARDAERRLSTGTGQTRNVSRDARKTFGSAVNAAIASSGFASSGRPASRIPRESISSLRFSSDASRENASKTLEHSADESSYFDEAIPLDAFSSDRVSYHAGETDDLELRRQAFAAAMSAAEATPPRPRDPRRFARSVGTSADDSVDDTRSIVGVLEDDRASPSAVVPALSPLSALANASFADAGSPAAASAFTLTADEVLAENRVGANDAATTVHRQTVSAAASKWRSAYDVVAAAHETESVRKKRSMYSRAAAAFGFAKKKPEATRGRWQ